MSAIPKPKTTSATPNVNITVKIYLSIVSKQLKKDY